MVYPIFRWILLLLVKLFVKDVKGTENIPKKGPFIVAANHYSYLDPFLIGCYIVKKTNQKIHYIALRGGRFEFFGDFIIRRWAGSISIQYNRQGIAAGLEEANICLKKRGIVGIFPIGPGYSPDKPGTGVARLALTAKCPVLPVTLKGTKETMPIPSLVPRKFRHITLNYKKLLIFTSTNKVKRITKIVQEAILPGVNGKK